MTAGGSRPLGTGTALGAHIRYASAEWMLAGRRRATFTSRLRPGFRDNLVGPATCIVIEGYPRSANSYAVDAFRVANGKDVPMGHHLHSPVNIELGVARGLPVVVLVRQPLDAAASLLLRAPAMPPRMAVLRYVRFHQRVLPLLGDVVIAPFELVVRDFGKVIDEVNDRFGTSFRRYEHTPKHEATVLWETDWSGRVHGDDELAIGRPSALRAKRKPMAVEAVMRHRAELDEAERLYETVMAEATLQP